ncbi:MAG: hypothetical protein ACXW5J_03220 [Thermoanaerobaculia bacterium]
MLTPHNLAGLHSTLHVVTEKVDGGPILSLSRAYPVAPFVHQAAATGHMDIVKAYSYAQREWMMRDAWGEMALGLVGGWRLAVGGRNEELIAKNPPFALTANRQPSNANQTP